MLRSRAGVNSPRRAVAGALAILLLLVAGSRTAWAIPAFARKTGLRCSACHEAWPKLTAFGQNFKDNGYEIGNERDAPVYLSPLMFPISLRVTPAWHKELNTAVPTDQSAAGVQRVSTQGFDLSGMDLLAEGLLAKDITFLLLPSSDEYGNFHFESVWVRLDRLLKSPWLNVKAGKFELDTMVSEKRTLTLSQNGQEYEIYHYLPAMDPVAFSATPSLPGESGVSTTGFGLGDNQLGAEVMGHSGSDYTRYSVALLSSSDGSVNLPAGGSYDTFLTGSQSVNTGRLGMQRFAVFSYIGRAPTRFLTQTTGGVSAPLAGSGYGNKGFTRTGVYGLLKAKRVSITPMFTHATESAFIALGIPSSEALPVGVRSPAWNGRMLELNYIPDPKVAVTARYEDIRNTRQTFASSRRNYGDLDAETVSLRYYPFNTSRDGLALHLEYSKVHTTGISSIGGDQTLRSGFIGWDFAF